MEEAGAWKGWSELTCCEMSFYVSKECKVSTVLGVMDDDWTASEDGKIVLIPVMEGVWGSALLM